MKKRISAAILLATTMMLALMGCGDASATTMDSSDTSSVAEVNTDTDSDKDTDTETEDAISSDSDSEESTDKADSSVSSSAGTIEYKGETFCATDSLKANLDKADKVAKIAPGYPLEMDTNNSLYFYDEINKDKGDYGLAISTFEYQGEEIINGINSSDPEAKTPKGIHPGSTKDEVIAAYGDPLKINDSFYVYSDYQFIIENGKVITIGSENPVWVSDYITG